ncbi:MAG: patatin-like phospholipase family protein, partial [Pseudomonadota bacterium]
GTGLISGRRLARLLEREMEGVLTQNLPISFVAIAAELKTGHEFWLSEGPLVPNVQASYALPGIFPPVRMNGRWLIDGAVVNPIPVSTARAKGARVVIAVNLSTDSLGRGTVIPDKDLLDPVRGGPLEAARKAVARKTGWSLWRLFRPGPDDEPQAPSIPNVMIDAYNIIQDRIARSRLAGDPPDASIDPKVGAIGLYEFYRAEEAIQEGRAAAERALPNIEDVLRALS